MFQTAELGQKVTDQEFKERQLPLWHSLLLKQLALRKAGVSPVLIDFAGVRGAGKSESTNLLNKWMDTRWITTHGYGAPTEAERVRPLMWRYWMRLPPRGQIGIYLSGRYTAPLLDFVYKRIGQEEFDARLERINTFEKALADDGALILKFWMHIGRDVQKERLERLDRDESNEWRITEADWENFKNYDRFIEVAEQIISRTNKGHAPWEIVEGVDPNYRSLRVGEVVLKALDRHITRVGVQKKFERELNEHLGNGAFIADAESTPGAKTVFSTLDLEKKLSGGSYLELLAEYQSRLGRLQHLAWKRDLSTILVFEGPDASGKGGAIRRITNALDARRFKVHPFAAPTEEEYAHHYLWRFWRCLSRAGRLTIFDRSWYGRVLVERVEGYATDAEWRRAYAEINQFESQLVEHGILLLKFWVQITEEEQLRRFKAREATPHKQWKQTAEDWRNRERWHEYQAAAHDMVQSTDTRSSPWILVEGNKKHFARIKVLKRLCNALENALEQAGP